MGSPFPTPTEPEKELAVVVYLAVQSVNEKILTVEECLAAVRAVIEWQRVEDIQLHADLNINPRRKR